jgi:serine/threonine protein kinase
MPIMPAAGVEIIPGYRLVERLGFGGYGEVWKVTAPGGLFKAMKIVYGDLSGPRAEQELRSLERIKAVRYPFLLSLERFEIVHGQLVIVTELADCSLMNRYQECRKGGLPGIPRDELLGYFADAADGLDHMNETHDLQHLDIKPENLLLLSGRIKVADFGLVKDLVGASTNITGGVTPIYAPAEAFDGRVSRYSDQYSLAIVYQEMLTGQRPFQGTTAFQLAAQHSTAPPLLDALPAHDRPIVGQALSKVPEQRFRSCREFVARLRAASSGQSPPSLTPVRTRAPTPYQSPKAPAGHGALARPTPPASSTSPGQVGSEGVKTLVTKGPVPEEIDRSARPVLPPDPEGWRPVLFVGVGGLAGRTLRQLRGRLHRESGSIERLPIIRMLLIDTDRASLRHAQQGPSGEALLPEETLHCPLFPTEHYREESAQVLTWLDRRWLYGIPRSLLTEGLRPLARLALVDRATFVLSALREAITRVSSQEARTAAVGFTGRTLRSDIPRVVLVAAIGGGTGGGMVLDLGYAARQVLEELGLPTADLTAMLVHRGGQTPDEKARGRINAYATLRELRHWNNPDIAFPGAPERGLRSFAPGQAPFDDCYLLVQPEDVVERSLDVLVDRLSGYLHFDATFGGGYLDRLRHASKGKPAMTLRSGGFSILGFPRAKLRDLTSAVLARRLLESWTTATSPSEQGRIQQQAREFFVAEASGEALRNQFELRLPALLGEPAQDLYDRLVGAGERDRTVPAGSQEARHALEKIEGHLGAGSGAEDMAPALTTLETAFLSEAARLADGVSTRLVDWLLDNVERPGRRLNAAQIGLDTLTALLRAEAEKTLQRLFDLQTRRLALRLRFAGEEGMLARLSNRFAEHGFRGLLQGSSIDAPRPWQLFSLRVKEMVAESVHVATQRVLDQLTLWAVEFPQARRNLTEFLDTFPRLALDDPAATGKPPADQLLPFGAAHLGAAVTATLAQLPAGLLGQLDRAFQSDVLDSCGGLWTMLVGHDEARHPGQEPGRSPESMAFWNMVGGEKTPSQELRDELIKRARLLIVNSLNEINSSTLFLERNDGPGKLARAIQERLVLAQTTSLPPGAWRHALFVLPGDPTTGPLRSAIEETLQNVPHSVVEAGDAIAVSWETAGLSLEQVGNSLASNDPQVVQLAEQLQTRRDVPWSPL